MQGLVTRAAGAGPTALDYLQQGVIRAEDAYLCATNKTLFEKYLPQ
ncbi:MAG: hypothetical protein HYZ53_29915 [Planctomycetes bacterium]|nr:hypothetical protein [Planctomycetota bacterium]